MAYSIVRSIILTLCVLHLSACSSMRLAQLEWRLGLDAEAARQPVAPEVREEMARYLAEGAAALAGNDLDATLAAWRRYVAIAPVHLAEAKTIRGYLTLLQAEAAKRLLRQAIAEEQAGGYAPADRLHLAVFPFQNQAPPGSPPSQAFNRALVAMITTDLAQVPALKVLERAKIEQLVAELRLAESGLVEAASANARGRLLGAGTVVAGTVYNEAGPGGPGTGRYKINAAVSAVDKGAVIGQMETDGRQSDFFRQEKEIVHGILAALDIRDYPAAVDKVHTRSWAAYVQFATGLQLLAEARFDAARQAFHQALRIDPGFGLAEAALLDTPEQLLGMEEIKARFPAGG